MPDGIVDQLVTDYLAGLMSRVERYRARFEKAEAGLAEAIATIERLQGGLKIATDALEYIQDADKLTLSPETVAHDALVQLSVIEDEIRHIKEARP